MKVEFELDLNSKGTPLIKFKHHDKSSSLEQKILKVFIDCVMEKGCVIKNTGGHIGDDSSFEKYEIQICE